MNQSRPPHERIESLKAPEPVGLYPHARRVGGLLFLSGVGPRERGTKVIPGVELDACGDVARYDIAAQCHSVFRNVRAILEEAGARWEDLVDVTVFLTNMRDDFATYNRLWAEYFHAVQPCRTTVEVSRLPTPIAIELKCIAALEKALPMPISPPLDLKGWVDAHRDRLKPPVGNQQVWEDRDFMVTVVGGPNARADYHVNQGEEFFYQLEGDITLRIIDDGVRRDLRIAEGAIFLLPPRVPHSPQRPAGTVGLVIERKRALDEDDGFVWYCERCNTKLYEEVTHVTNLVTQLPPIFDRFYGNPAHSTCSACGVRASRPR